MYCTELTHVNGYGVTEMHSACFYKCTALKRAKFVHCRRISSEAFAGTRDVELTLGGKNVDFAHEAFADARNLKIVFDTLYGGSLDLPMVPHGVSYQAYLQRR